MYSFIAFLLCERVGYGLVRLDGFPHGFSIRLCYFPAFLGRGRRSTLLHAEECLTVVCFRNQIVMGQAQCKLMADSNATGFFFRA
jgi:hypothetical protein